VELGVVLPNGVVGVEGRTLLEWARRAEQRGFDIVGVIGRVAYPAYEELVTLAAVAAVTERVKLMPTVIVAPVREPVLFAKQAASLNSLSGGRLVLGLGVGMRPDDFLATGTTFEDRGKRFDAMLEAMHSAWHGDPPIDGSRAAVPATGNIPIYFGTLSPSPKIARRIARYGDGYLGVGSPQMVAPIVEGLQKAWADEGRDGRLRLGGASYFTLTDPDAGRKNILDYYEDFFPQLGHAAAAAMPTTVEAVRRVRDVYHDAGYDQVLFSACTTDPAEVDRLADALQ
jgi:alkanesulfonate monooxygenase SsuD/methylene tetrahydromethanopterin reductase-like flavin-dependent oxidoreductase (luciferase family)